jgi:hypothetical protein
VRRRSQGRELESEIPDPKALVDELMFWHELREKLTVEVAAA